MTTRNSSSDHGPVDRLAEEFLESHRRGEGPSIDDYADRYPEWAEEIRETFPALLMIERFKPTPDDLTGSYSGSGDKPGAGRRERLGDYRILREIGRGGMGIVYEAIQEPLGRHVALKVLPWENRANQSLIARFRQEASSAASLHHTNIVPVFEVGEHEGDHYYSMQFIRGLGLDVILRDLRRLRERPPAGPDLLPRDDLTVTVARAHGLTDGDAITPEDTVIGPDVSIRIEPEATPPSHPSSPERSELLGSSEARYYRGVARIGARVADALAHAHAKRVFHRDIKPSNLLLDAAGVVWVADFGLAKTEDSGVETEAGDVVGTLRYMSPERFKGVTDGRVDVYSLGATLYELLTLRPVFDGRDRLRLIDQIAQESPVPLRRIDPLIPRDLEAIVLKSLAKVPAHRYASAAELRDELDRFVQGRPTKTRPLSRPERIWRWCRSNPQVAGLIGLASTLTIVIAVVSTLAAYYNGRLASRLQASNVEVNRNLTQAKKNLFQSLASEASSRRQSRRVGQRFEALDSIERAMRIAKDVGISTAERSRLRNEAIAAMALPDLRIAKELHVPRAKENGFAVDPAFERYAFRNKDGAVVIRRLVDDVELLRLPGLPPGNETTTASFSPDGRYLGLNPGTTDILQIWDIREGRLVVTDREKSYCSAANWSFRQDSRELALAHQDGSIVFYELPSGQLRRRWSEHAATPDFAYAWALAYSPDGSMLAIRPNDGQSVQVFSCERARLLTTLHHSAYVNHIAWNPRQPDILGVACEDGTISIWDVQRATRKRVMQCETRGGMLVAYHPGGELLASRDWDGVLRLWEGRTGRQLLSRPSIWSTTLGFDRTGRWLSMDSSQETVRILELADAAECRTLVAEPYVEGDRHRRLVIDPTGRRLATTGSRITLWDLPSGTNLATLPVPSHENPILFDRSGALLTGLPALLRWPISGATDGTRVGPPQILHPQGTSADFDMTPDGRAIVAAMHDDGGLVLDTRDTRPARWLRPHADVRAVAISPDGRWAVTASHHDRTDKMKLWDVQTGRLVHDFPGIPDDVVSVHSFSPDGRWLAVYWDGLILFETTTWKSRVRLFRGVDSGFTFAADSRTAVYNDHAGSLVMVEVETGRELARFEDPDQLRSVGLALTEDGSNLVTTLADRPYLRVWDLRAIRRRLAGLGLDWGSPATFDGSDAPATFPPLPKPFRVDRGYLESGTRQVGETPELIVERTTRAIEVDPTDLEAYRQRGHALDQLGRREEAIADFTAALEARPDDADLRASRGLDQFHLNRLDEAVADCDSALRAAPGREMPKSLPLLCFLTARALKAAGRLEEALSVSDRAIRLVPGDGLLQQVHGWILLGREDWDGAIAAYREAIRLSQAGDPYARHELGVALRNRWRLGEAMAELDQAGRLFEQMIRHSPDDARLPFELGDIRREAGEYPAALKEYRRAHEMGSRNPSWSFPTAQRIRECERLVELDRRLPAMLRGEDRPADDPERAEFALFTYEKGWPAASARFREAALASRPDLAEEPRNGERYNAACCASLAGGGIGRDDPPPDDGERTRFRQRALAWLRADLAAWSKRLDADQGAVPEARRMVGHWLVDPDLACVRDRDALAKLSEPEREGWRTLWAEVEAMISRLPGR